MHQFPFQECIQTQGSEQGKGQGTNQTPEGFRARFAFLSMGLMPLSPLGCHKINSSSHRRCNFTSFASRGGCCFLLETQHPSASLAQLLSWGSSVPKYLLWNCLPKYLLQDCPFPGVRHSHSLGCKASPQGARAPYPMAQSTWNKINPTAIHLQFQSTQTAPICSADGGSCWGLAVPA